MTQVIDRVRNGVDSRRLSETLDAIQAEPALGVFQFRAHNQWVDGAHTRSSIQVFYGAGQPYNVWDNPSLVSDYNHCDYFPSADGGRSPRSKSHTVSRYISAALANKGTFWQPAPVPVV